MNGAYEQINPEPSQPMATPGGGGGSSWIAWVVGIVLVILVGGGLYYYYQYIKIPELNKRIDNLQQQVDQLNKAKEESDTTAQEVTTEGQKITYTAGNLGFEITLPSAFKNFKTTESNDQDIVQDYIHIWIPTTDTNFVSSEKGYANPATVEIYTKAAWDGLKTSERPELLGEVGSDSGFVAGLTTWNDNVHASGSNIVSSEKPTDLTNFLTDSLVKQIKDSFKETT